MKIRRLLLVCCLILPFAYFSALSAEAAPETASILRNGGFDSTGIPGIPGVNGSEGWIFSLNGGGAGGQAKATIAGGVLRVGDYVDPGKMIYAIQVMQAKVTVIQGVRYRIQFDAKADAKRAIKVKVGGLQTRDWADYTKVGGGGGDGMEFQLTTDMKTYSSEFQMDQPTDKSARFEFELGLRSAAVWISNVSLTPLVTAGSLVRDGSLQNGDFSQDSKYWDVTPAGSAATAAPLSLKAANGELTITIVKSAPAAKLSQSGLYFEKGKSYQLSFYARSDRNREIKLEAGNRLAAGSAAAFAANQVFQLGAANQPFTFSFTFKDETTANGAGELAFGFAAAADSAPATVTLSKLALVELDRPVVEFVPLTASELVKNGNFELDAGGWTGNGGTRLSVDNGRLKVVVPAAAAGPSAAPAVATAGLELKAGSAYLVSVVASSDTPKSLLVSLKGKQGKEYLDAKAATIACGAKEGYWQFYVEVPANDSATLSFLAPVAGTFLLDRISLRTTGPWMDTRKPVAERVKLLMAQMNLDEKVGQMVQSERAAAKPGDVKNYGIGSILSGGGSVPPANTPAGWIGMFNRFQSEAISTRLAIPILYGIDAVHGHGNVYGATIFPQNIGLGATRDPGLLEKIGAVTALEVAATGLNWTFGPCVAVSRDERWGRAYESFGESPELQTLLTGSFVKGLQGSQNAADWMKGSHVVGTAKHFMGDGGAEWGTGEGSYTIDRGDIKTLTLDQLKAIHGQGYVQAVRQGIGTVMASFNMFKGIHMSVNKTLLTDYLKGPVASGGLGFEGFVIGDWDAFSLVSELEGDYATKVLAAYNAGMDMAMEQSRWSQVIKILRDGVKGGAISQSRIDDAVRRILTVKFNSGAFEKPWALDALADQLGTAANRAVAAQAVRESLVLLKNDQNVLPLRKNAKIFVSGPIADNVGLQSGGWTMQWQGGSDRNGQRLTPGNTILEGMKALAKANGGEIITDIGRAAGCDVAVVVVGETPYAEGVGDIGSYGRMTLDDGKVAPGNLSAIRAAQALKIPVVVIVVSGRPLIITQEVAGWNALVAAWLPGSEGAAVADVLYGLVNFKGLLPVTWPKTLDQLPINVRDVNYDKKDPLFPYGYGLKYPENMRN